MLKGFTRKYKPLEILTEEQIDAIHKGTLDVLEQTGMRFEHERALKLFKKNGCEVDFEKRMVRFPPGLVEESLRKTPSSWRWHARAPKDDIIVGGNTVYFGAFPGMQTVDLDTLEPRTATKQEYAEGVRVLDALNNTHMIHCYTPYFGFDGVPEVMKMPESLAVRIKNSSKVTFSAHSNDCEVFAIQMAAVTGADYPCQCLLSSPPLTYYADAPECVFRVIEAGLPIRMSVGDVYGATSPATIAGSTITVNAELIAGIVLAQLINPGQRIIINDYSHPLNMRQGSPSFGSIGAALHRVMFNQMWRKYELPIYNLVSPTSSKEIDFQHGYEKGIGVILSAISGANIVNFIGSMYGEIAHHPVQAILDDDIAGMVGRFIEGVKIIDETLAIDLIETVGPIPGHYLNKEHTRKWWKKEQFMPMVADRLTYPEWIDKGKKSALDYAKERMDEIRATHEPTPLPEDQYKEIDEILKKAKQYYKERGLF